MKRNPARALALTLALLVVLTWSVTPALARPDGKSVVISVTDIPEPPEGGDGDDVLASDGDGDDLVGGNESVPDIATSGDQTIQKQQKGFWQRMADMISRFGLRLKPRS